MTMAPNIQIEVKFEQPYQIYVVCPDGGLTLRQTGHRCIPMADFQPSALHTPSGDDIGTLGIGCVVLEDA